MTHVIHVNQMHLHAGAVYCGRAVPRRGLRASPFANPFKVGMDGTREQVIEAYRRWIRALPDLIARARRELTGKALACWCFPQKCHCDVLAEICEQEQP